jgi:hypothetical protein
VNDISILVNTSDSFEDCWNPFFQLFATYWPDCDWPIVLNTETKNYSYPGLNIRCARVAEGESRRLSWSECLMRCLDGIATPYLLYLQEDYFLEGPVQAEKLKALVDEMRAGRADVIRVMECGGSGPWHATKNPELWRVDQNARYRIALQAALWRTNTLRGQLRAHESPWQLEAFGSARARRNKSEKVLCVNRDLYHGQGKEIFPYTPTGVVSGRWQKRVVVDLFGRHGIEMDFTRRGFYGEDGSPKPRAPLVHRLADRLRSLW